MEYSLLTKYVPDIPKDEFVSVYQQAVTYIRQNCKDTLMNLQEVFKSPPTMTLVTCHCRLDRRTMHSDFVRSGSDSDLQS